MTDRGSGDTPEVAVHRTEPEEAADEGYPIDEIEEGTEWVPPHQDKKEAKSKKKPGEVAVDDHEA